MSSERDKPELADADIEQMLRGLGARPEPSPEASNEARAVVHAEWQAMLAQRRGRRNFLWGMAASALFAVAIGAFGIRYMIARPVQVAAVVNVEGRLQSMHDSQSWQSRGTGEIVTTGDTLQTDSESRAAFDFANHVSVRLDHDTTLRIAATDHVELVAGALYVDAPPEAQGIAAITVQTRAGLVQHIGTQYEVRTRGDAIEVSIREGSVQIRNDAGTSTAVAGEMIRTSIRGETARERISPQDSRWQWAAKAGPSFDIENATLADFLAWVARETGRHVVYASPQAQAEAQEVKLRGSIKGLELDTALNVVLSTTTLRQHETPPDSIGIDLASAIDSARDTRPTL